MPPLPSKRSYRIKKTDSALSLPGRVTFPQNSYVQSPAPNNIFAPAVNAGGYGGTPPRTPYQMGTGTPVSGLAGNQGASSAMLPTGGQYLGQGTYLNSPQRTTYNQPNSAYNDPQRGRGLNANYSANAPQSVGSFMSPGGANVAGQYPWLAGNQPTQSPSTGAPGTVAPGGAAPFGVNAYGERLTSAGDVWNPATATTDIYGGRFIQVGETRWERNARGRLVKVQYGKGGKKTIVSGGKNQSKNRNNSRNDTRGAGQQQAQQSEDSASMFVSFRA